MVKKISTFHVIASTRIGGAERMLERFLKFHESAKSSLVISLTDIGTVGNQIKKNGVDVITMNIKNMFDFIFAIARYHKLVKKFKPRHVIGWMYHGNLFISLFFLFFKGPYAIWNIRCGLSDYKKWPSQRKLVLKLCRYTSKSADKIIYNSKKSQSQHNAYGFSSKTSMVIYNGFSPHEYKNTKDNNLRRKLGISDDVFLIGSFGRNIAIKRMSDLMLICQALQKKGCPAHILYIGRNFKNDTFMWKARQMGVHQFVHIISEVPSLSPYYKILDVFCLCSEAEGFPNVIGEAAYSGVPVISTDISDLKDFFKDWQVCDVGDIEGLASAAYRVFNLIKIQRQELIKDQQEAFLRKTQITNVAQDMAEAFFN